MPTQQLFVIKQSRLTIMSAIALLALPMVAHAGAGWADNTDKSGAPFKQPTYYANSPMGTLAAHGPAGSSAPEGTQRDTGTALRKFVDTLPLVDGYRANPALRAANPQAAAGTTVDTWGNRVVSAVNRHVPTAIKEDLTSSAGLMVQLSNPAAHSISFPDADYYEIAVVEYREQLHSDLPPLVPDRTSAPGLALNTGLATGGTTLRGYVQIWTPNLPSNVAKTPLFYPGGKPILDTKGNPVFAAGDGPHYLGPIISSDSHVPVRIKFNNYLPTGHYDPITKTRGGDSFVPTDLTMPGCGLGPNGAIDANAPQPFERYTQNRTNIHMHGGDTPWISDGEPHTWITPAGENTPYPAGAATQNVPDMPDPGPGAQTLFYPNNQSARMMWYHDHSFGSTRLDVYAGIVSAFMIHDAVEAAMQSSSAQQLDPVTHLPAVDSTGAPVLSAGALAGMDEIPLIYEDKTFVPKDVLVEDAKWNTDTWGKYGDLWFPHVYEANQNPDSIDGTNPAGRWDYGPWFWPVFPAPLALPTGVYGDVSSTQEQYADTPLINGVAYPNFNVEPKAYRFRMLNASLQRYLSMGLYVAEPLTLAVASGGGNYSAASTVTIGADVNGNVPIATLQINPIAAPSVVMRNGGNGYNPATTTVTFSGGGALTQATGHVVIRNGVIRSVVVDTAGSGYSSVPTITFTDSATVPGTGAAASAQLNPGGDIAAITLAPAPAGITYKYTIAPTVTITDPTKVGKGATVAVSVNTEVPMVPAVLPPTGAVYGPNTYDGRPGGIPDPTAWGPNIIHIGTEGGFLAQPNVIRSTPVSYDLSRRNVTVLNVLDYGLYIGPAERADFVVDFSQYAGKTLILYNDCPAPNPGFDTRVDYFTGDGDQTGAGGQDNTQPGYGPNTRTMMRIQVAATQFNGAAPAAPYDPLGNGGPLATAIPAAFAATQDKPIVPQSWQNTAYGTHYTDNIAHIYAGTAQQPTYTFNEGGVAQTLTGFQLDSAGAGYTLPPLVTLTGGVDLTVSGNRAATAHAVLDMAGQRVIGIQIDDAGVGYTSAPLVSMRTAPGDNGVGASATALTSATQTVQVQNKGIQELFDSNYGRMNATFSTELPFTSVLAQTTVPLGYADPPTEQIADGETQFWKITHNGVDAHVVHFHLFNVQVINRVGWDGTLKKINPQEFGWKETVKMMPLEDIYVAVKPKSPLAPFGVPQSVRLLDPTQPWGASAGFTQVNPMTGLATATTNDYFNFNWEYVWHCHILGHEENDFMRPMIFDFGTQQPSAVPALTYSPTTLTLGWVDPTPAGAPATYGNKQNEQGFVIQRSDTVDQNGRPVFAPLPDTTPQSAAQASLQPGGASRFVVAANATSWTDINPATATTAYRVIAFNSAGYSPTAAIITPGVGAAAVTCDATSAVSTGPCTPGSSAAPVVTSSTAILPGATVIGTPNAPTGLHGSVGVFNYSNGSYPVTLTWNAGGSPTNGFHITRTGGTDLQGNILADATFDVSTATAAANALALGPTSTAKFAFTDPGTIEISGYKYTVQTDNGTPARIQPATDTTPAILLAPAVPLLSPSTYVDLTTPYAPPPAITHVAAALSASGNAVTVNWAAPAMTSPDANIPASSHVTAYNIVRTSGSGASSTSTTFAVQQMLNPLSPTSSAPPATTFVDVAPPGGVSSYTVYGVNGNVTGTLVDTSSSGSTASVTVTPQNALPGMTAATATAVNAGAVSVNWAPAPAGFTPTGVQITRTTAGTTGAVPITLAGPKGLVTSFIDNTVMQNTTYTYTVTWVGNGLGGLPMTTAAVTTPYAPATDVVSLTATESTVNPTNTLTWAAGGPTTGYIVSRATAGSATFQVIASGLTTTTFSEPAPGAGTGVVNVYQVQAMNGPVNVSSGVRATISDVIPVSPTALTSAVAAKTITLTWPAGPAVDTSYLVQRSADSGVTWTTLATVAAPAVRYADTTGVPGTTYQYRVFGASAATGVAAFAASPIATVYYLLANGANPGSLTVNTTATTYTLAPAGALAAAATGTTATRTLTVPFTAGAVVTNAPAITGFNIWAYVNGATVPTKLTNAALAATAVTGNVTVNLGSTYAVFVTAVNGAGESLPPLSASLPVVQVGQPAPVIDTTTPPKLTTATGTTDTVTVDWSPVTSSINGLAVTAYTLQWSTSSAFTTGANTVTATVSPSGVLTAQAGVSGNTTTGTGPTAVNRTTFTTVARGKTAPTTASNVIYFRVNAVAGATTLNGSVTLLNQATTPKLP